MRDLYESRRHVGLDFRLKTAGHQSDRLFLLRAEAAFLRFLISLGFS
jgi:hypothetical protein